MKINKFTIISICLYAMTFLNIRYFSEYYLLRDACIVVVAIYLFLNIKQIYRKCSKSIIAVILLFIGILIVSFCFNYDSAKSHRNDLIIFSVSLIEIFMCLSFNSDKNRMSQLIDVFYKLQIFFVLLNDMMIFAAPDLAVKYNECYLLGDKFTVGYQHLLLVGLLLTRVIMKEKAININVKLKIIGLTLLTLSVATATNSATSLVLIPLFALFVILKAKGHDFIYSKVGYMTILTLSTLFVEKLLGLKRYVTQQKEALFDRLFKSSNDNEVQTAVEMTYYYEEWRECAVQTVEPIADRVINESICVLKQYFSELAEQYQIHLKQLLNEQIAIKEEVSAQLSEDELKLQIDNDWFAAFQDQLRNIERG